MSKKRCIGRRLIVSHLVVAGIAFQSGIYLAASSYSSECHNKLMPHQQHTSSASSFQTETLGSIRKNGDAFSNGIMRDMQGSSTLQTSQQQKPISSEDLLHNNNARQTIRSPNNPTVTNTVKSSSSPPFPMSSSLQFRSDTKDMEPSASKNFVHGVAWTKQTSFQKFYDLGLPLERLSGMSDDERLSMGMKKDDPHQNVLLLYLDPSARPKDYKAEYDLFRTIPNAQAATEDCQELQVVVVSLVKTPEDKETGNHKKCLAIMPHWGPSAYVHRFSRPFQNKTDTDAENVNDTHQANSNPANRRRRQANNSQIMRAVSARRHQEYATPRKNIQMDYVSHTHRTTIEAYHWNKPFNPQLVQEAWSRFANYVEHYETALEDLKPILEKAASSPSAAQSSLFGNSDSSKGVILVMVTNVARLQFLVNFVCAAKAIPMDLSNVLVFCLDQASYEVATKVLHLHAYQNANLFHQIPSAQPEGDGETFGDNTFSRTMIAKVYSVQLVNALGYDILFSDTDVVPLQPEIVDYFADRYLKEQKDIYLQYDHNERLEQAPFSSNSGFYFVKHNWRTQYFFETLVRMEDLILRVQSHQQVMTHLLSQFQSFVGLKVKVIGGYGEVDNLFPNGWYYQKKGFMQGIKDGTERPYIFHVNWNTNGTEKQSQLEKANLWFVVKEDENQKCSVSMDPPLAAENEGDSPPFFTMPSGFTMENCCMVPS